jgi:hypothetical protein
VHPKTSITDQEELSSLLQVPLVAGTINRGSEVIGAGQWQGWKKTRVKKKNQHGGVFWFFWVFFGFFIYLPRRESFRVFSVSRKLLGASKLKILITHTN